ncbi:hypothetical protein JTE90_007782 [Oedothorax gibbosus]|uniref:Medium-chain acyl-CoA ligase ACSF2, mitochondrial n=1 Tax=Oedothorax gibbosus TaxID=931172 RepID=A0AAV6TTV1_9ARAC|nr:hypothetical protein JTE90_007782 [Oedothorax gibbosus]
MNSFIKGSISTLTKYHASHFRCMSISQQKIKNSYFSMPGNTLLLSSTLGQVLDQSADKCGDGVAIISDFQGIKKSYLQLRHETERLASAFISLGLNKGDRIAICSPNSYEWSLTQYAAARAGLILVNINPASQPKELEYCLKKVDCKSLVIWDTLKSQNYYQILSEIIPNLPNTNPGNIQLKSLPFLESIIMISDEKRNGVFNFKDVLEFGTKESDEKLSTIEKTLQFDDPLNIQYTSGTTGLPKGALLSHHNLVNNAQMLGARLGFHVSKPIACCHLPLFHAFGCVLGSISVLMYQGTIVFPSPGFDSVSSLKAIEKYKCTDVFGTPTMYVDMIHHCKQNKFDTTSLKQAIVGGAASTESLINDIFEEMKVPSVLVGYGATELSPAVATNSVGEPKENVTKGILRPFEYAEFKIVDDKGHLVPVGSQGELCVRGHYTFMGYWNEEEKTAEVLNKTHWYHTGDVCVMNEDGYIRIVGRKKDMIIRGGENVYPQEIENFINTHPAVQDAYVCGVPDKRMGEEACAWIHLNEDIQLTADEVRNFCKGKISHYKIPRYIIFVDEFPKTPTGKVKKYEMTNISIEKLKL